MENFKKALSYSLVAFAFYSMGIFTTQEYRYNTKKIPITEIKVEEGKSDTTYIYKFN